MKSNFPSERVCEILGIKVPKQGDTFVRMEYTRNILGALLAEGIADPKENQNDSPTIQELYDMGDKNTTYEGYVVFPPRTDARISVDGIHFEFLDAKGASQKMEQMYKYKPDELDKSNHAGTYTVRAWWD